MTAPEPRPTIEDRGPGEPELAVVGGVHSNEPSGVRAVERLCDADLALQRGVRFVIANPPAVAADERYLDTDLNRIFPVILMATTAKNASPHDSVRR